MILRRTIGGGGISHGRTVNPWRQSFGHALGGVIWMSAPRHGLTEYALEWIQDPVSDVRA